MSLITLSNIQFSYSGSKDLVLDVESLVIEKGERVFVYGPSGSGKSTLLEILAGVLIPQKGSVEILSNKLETMSPESRDAFRASHMGYVFQSFNLIPYLSVQENIELPLFLSLARRARLRGISISDEIHRITKELGIIDLLTKNVTELSIGQQQRVAVARALLGKPEIILADEPTSSLDYDHRERFIKLLFQVCDEVGSSVVFVSHDRTLEKLFTRVVSFSELNKVSKKRSL